MEQIIVDMMLKYPSILPVNSENKEFLGYLPVNGVDYKLHIKQEDDKRFHIAIDPKLEKCSAELLNLEHSSKCIPIITVLDQLKTIILSNTSPAVNKNFTDIFKHILSEYVELREFYINIHKSFISHDLSVIKISYLDESCRQHKLEITTNLDLFKEVFRVKSCSLPDKKDCELFPNSNSLKAIYEKFLNIIERLQYFFDSMDSIDANCHIIDPERPSRKDCYRRINLDVTTSMVITLDPWNDASIPSIIFLGPERTVEGFRQKLANNLINWKSNGDMLEEILKLLELSSFPTFSKINDNKEEIILCNVGECCICFSLRLNNMLPEIVCSNSSCEQSFHKECLYQWLISVNARQSFNVLNGQCPNCEKPISCPLYM